MVGITAWQSVAASDHLKLAADGCSTVITGWTRRQTRGSIDRIVNGHQVVAFHEHVPAHSTRGSRKSI